MHEYRKVIGRPRFRKLISETQIERFLTLLLPNFIEVEISTVLPLSRDPKDNYLLAIARKADADYLVTGDDDLLELKHIGNTLIVNMSELGSLLKI
ncbi:MAG: putative toxin-antitoxin system toxin component, PIN family [Pyrinomonadaceae bacterium]